MILFLGFPKTGTVSFEALFRGLGYRAEHFTLGGEYVGELIYRAKREGLPLLDYVEQRRVPVVTLLSVCLDDWYNFWPQLDLYRDLYHQYPHNVYVLNRRDPADLYRSFCNFGGFMDDFAAYNQHRLAPYDGDLQARFMALVRDHYRAVTDFFGGLDRAARFVDFDIDRDSSY